MIRGLAVTGFAVGIFVGAGGDNSSIVGSFVGVPDGFKPNPNGDGIVTASGATGATIGGTDVEDRNVISGNRLAGIAIEGPDAVIQGNLIGTDRNGSTAVGGDQIGILLSTSTNTTIGDDGRVIALFMRLWGPLAHELCTIA